MENGLIEDRQANRQGAGWTIVFVIVLVFIVLAVAYLQFNAGFTPGGAGLASGMVTTSSGLQYQDVEVGTGTAVEAGDMIFVHYTGYLSDGTKFDSSLDRGQPFLFTVGVGFVIPGWDEGMTGMREGGSRRLIIPPALAYGPGGAGAVIPPNETLTFEVELLEIASVEFDALVVGEGREVQLGDTVSVAYTGYLEDGQIFDSTQNHGQLLQFTIGARQMLPGLELAVMGMKVGGKRLVTIPPNLAFGDQGVEGLIPPGSTLTFELELVELQ